MSDNHKDYRNGSCEFIIVQVLTKELDDLKKGDQNYNFSNVLNKEGYFEVDYDKGHSAACFKCEHSGGVCGSSASYGFLCFCKDEADFRPYCVGSG